MNPLDFIPKSVLGLAVVALLTTNVTCAYKNGKLELEVSRKATELAQAQRAHSDATLAAQRVFNEAQVRYRDREHALQVAHDNQRKKTDETVTQLAKQRDDLRLRLSAATDNGATGLTLAATPPSPKATTGRGDITLVSESVGELIDEAFRADLIRVELLSCYRAYDEARGQ